CVGAGNRFGGWQEFCGTSAASPVVAGALALARALRPTATAGQLTAALTGTADPLPAAWTASGRVNARGAVGPFLSAGGPHAVLFGVDSGGFLHGAAFPLSYGAAGSAGVATVSLLVNGTVVGTAAGEGPHAATVDTRALRRGSRLTVVAEDGDGAVGTAAVPVVVDNTPPSATITSPRPGQLVRGRVPVATRATDTSGIAGVELSVAGLTRATDTAAPYAPVWDSRGLDGPVRLYARTRDRAGHTTLRYQMVTADSTAPSVARTGGPGAGARVRGTASVSARSADRYGVARVDLLINGRVAARDARAPFVLPVAAARQPRTMRVQLRAVDRAGNARLSAAWRWTR
ncbi:MAG TPA: Ig-like domain-containing protein, partial [Pilimelia sp.]|nr:Ig-like domain-containing protein [Pilimelia sp.]